MSDAFVAMPRTRFTGFRVVSAHGTPRIVPSGRAEVVPLSCAGGGAAGAFAWASDGTTSPVHGAGSQMQLTC